MNEKCIIYSAHGRGYTHEALHSAQKSKQSLSDDITFVLHTDKKPDLAAESIFSQTLIQEVPEYFKDKRYGFKIQGMIKACEELSFKYFLFLDADAFVQKAEAEEVFDLLKHFDIAAAHAHVRISPLAGKLGEDPLVPKCFPEFNTGVIAFKKSSMTTFEKWLDIYTSEPVKPDQPAFRKAIYTSDLRVATLTPEYNNRSSHNNNCFIWHNRNALRSIIAEQ